MYDYIDRHPNELCNTERFLLWAMRGWGQSAARKVCPPQALHHGFAGVGAASALGSFHLAMVILNRDGVQRLALAPMDCSRIAEDEALLLAVWRGIGIEGSRTARGTLELLVKDEAVKSVARAMAACSTALALAGFTFPAATVS